MNWAPLAEFIEARSGEVRIGTLANLDTNGAGWSSSMSARIGFQYTPGEAQQLTKLVDEIHCWRPTAILLATVQSPPECDLLDILSFEQHRPVIIAAQHGFVQRWERYQSQTCFDYFLTFGPMFLDQVAGDRRFRSGALPKLDAIQPRRFRSKNGTILFAPQTHEDPQVRALLTALSKTHRILLRPHPAARNLYEALVSDGLVERSTEQNISDAMHQADIVLTTGSTVVLEALAAQTPVAVLPFQHGEDFSELNIVLKSYDFEECLAMAARQHSAEFGALRSEFLERSTGSFRSNRCKVAFLAIRQMTQDFRQLSINRGSGRILLDDLIEAAGDGFLTQTELRTIRQKPVFAREILCKAFKRRSDLQFGNTSEPAQNRIRKEHS